MKLYENKKYSGAWNFGPAYNQNLNVKKLVKLMSNKLDVNLKVLIKKINLKKKVHLN